MQAVFEFLSGRIDSATLLSRAKRKEEVTEAHAYAGLVLLARGSTSEAAPHLKWVADQGSDKVAEYYVAVAHRRLAAADAKTKP